MNVRKFSDQHKYRPAYQVCLYFLGEAINRKFVANVGKDLQFRFDLFNPKNFAW